MFNTIFLFCLSLYEVEFSASIIYIHINDLFFFTASNQRIIYYIYRDCN